jgi:hypothetical protein
VHATDSLSTHAWASDLVNDPRAFITKELFCKSFSPLFCGHLADVNRPAKGEAQMITFGLVVAAVAYFLSYYAFSFWVILACIANGLVGVAWVARNPHGFARKMQAAGIPTDWFNPWREVMALVFGKAITLAVMGLFAWYLGERAGYF